MAATRQIQRIIIMIDTSGIPINIEAVTEVVVTENQLAVRAHKIYVEEYADLGVNAQERVDNFVIDVETFINNQEPLV